MNIDKMKVLYTGLTVGASIGTVATGIFSAKGETKAIAIREKNNNLNKKELFKKTLPAYLPAIAICAGTIGCIVGMSVTHAKAHNYIIDLLAANAVLLTRNEEIQEFTKDYREEVIESIGEEKEKKIFEKSLIPHGDVFDEHFGVSAEYVELMLPKGTNIGTKFAVRDEFMDRTFEASILDLERAIATVNRRNLTSLMWGEDACLMDFYKALGLTENDVKKLAANPNFDPNKLYWALDPMINYFGDGYIAVHFDFDDENCEIINLTYPVLPMMEHVGEGEGSIDEFYDWVDGSWLSTRIEEDVRGYLG